MGTMLGILGALLTVIPCVIAYKRKCANFVSIGLLSFFLSWTIIGWGYRDGLGYMGEVGSSGVLQTDWRAVKCRRKVGREFDCDFLQSR
jgi:Superinfection immunity protein